MKRRFTEAELALRKCQPATMTFAEDCPIHGAPPYLAPLKCLECDGSGQKTRTGNHWCGPIHVTGACPACNGTGVYRDVDAKEQ